MKNENKDLKLNNMEKEKNVAVLEQKLGKVQKIQEKKLESVQNLERKIKENKDDYRK